MRDAKYFKDMEMLEAEMHKATEPIHKEFQDKVRPFQEEMEQKMIPINDWYAKQFNRITLENAIRTGQTAGE